MAVAGCINAYDCAGCYLTTLQQLQSDNIGVAINYTAPGEYGRRQLDYIKYTDKCGCTCCLTGENELRIVATQGVIKNFTLTNDDTNEVVNVKWNDLFGSNRAYTMVRYKTGSYPTSITDGTLAVKETTQNQYASSGYNVSGLTDGTTYYFTAFAVSQDGTIIVVQNKNIETEFGYQPTANTQAYFKFRGNWNDSSGNGRNITATGAILYADRVGYNGTSSGILNFSLPRVSTRTVLIRVKYTGTATTGWRNITWLGGYSNSYYHGLFISDTNKRDITTKDGNNAISTVTPDNKWHLLAGVFTSGNSKLYLDGTLIATLTTTYGTGNNEGKMLNKNNETFIGYFGETIIEEGGRTQASIQSYYAKMKKYYTD